MTEIDDLLTETRRMSPLDALVILHGHKDVAYKSNAAAHVVSEAHKVLTEEATRLMQEQVKPLCTTCWGDGFNRLSDAILNGACQACNGTGKRS